MRKTLFAAICLFTLVIMGAGNVSAQLPNEWTDFFDSVSTFDGAPLPVGSIIKAFSADLAHCGTDTVTVAGMYGFMPVYGDDQGIPYDGASLGDSISFTINDRAATIVSGDRTWDPAAEPKNVRLDVASLDVTIAVTAVDLPGDTAVQPGEVHKVWVQVRNDGNGTDFYGINVSNDHPNFGEVIPSTVVYAEAGEVASLWFYIQVPMFSDDPNDIVSTVSFDIYSQLDPTKMVSGTFNVAMFISGGLDAPGNPSSLLPDQFTVSQNYPNPFNPTTNISFNLPSASVATLEVFDILGRSVSRIDLGHLAAGLQNVEYDGSALPSGIYFYRVVTAYASATKKMILLK